MNKVIKRKWLKELRSDTYHQGKGHLCRIDEESPTGVSFCCLGVLTDIYFKEGKGKNGSWDKEPSRNGRFIEKFPRGRTGDGELLNIRVMDWAGLDTSSVNIKTRSRNLVLSHMNDSGGRSFKQIANVIEKYL